tara:strand:+ start:23249 stop:23920 length:672 start_codon:yes stop_codon:yes gene_type:complete
MSNIVIPDGGTIGSASDTDAISISSTGKVTTADSELNVKSTSHTFTVKGIDSAISDSQSGTAPDTTDLNSGQFSVYTGSTKLLGITEHGYVLKPNNPHVFCRGYNSTTASSVLTYDSVETNNGNHFNNTTGLFTAPISGVYYVGIFSGYKSSDGYLGLYLVKNGAADIYGWSSYITNLKHANNTINYARYLSAGDTVGAGRTTSYTHPDTSTEYCCFSVFLLG